MGYHGAFRTRIAILVGAVALVGMLFLAISQGYATNMFIGNANGYPGASQTAVALTDMSNGQTIGQRIIEERAGQPPTPPKGSPAIIPPVTEAKVREYIAGHPLDLAARASDVQITSVQFVTVAELRRLLDNQPYYDAWSAVDPMVYVTFSGNFSVADMDNNINEYPYGFMVFSGLTGNQLHSGIGPAPEAK